MSTRKTAKIFGQRNWIGMAVVLALLGIGGGILLSGGSDSSGGRINLAGRARLISVEPLPDPAFEMDGVMCEWVPASASGSLFASLQQATPDEREAEREAIRQRKPLRIIKDRYASFSAVAVDPVRDEVVMADESLFQLLSYDRLTNTPPTASMSEPKRMIGGLDTKIDYICGLYIDPGSGDIYAINNDTVDTMVIFDRDAKGNLPPTRELYTPHGTYGIAVNEADKAAFVAASKPVYDEFSSSVDGGAALVKTVLDLAQ